MVTGIIGRKVGMTQVFAKDGTVAPATVIKAGPCVVLQAKAVATDGYEADHGGAVTACQGVTAEESGCFDDSTGHAFDGAQFPYLAANVVTTATDRPVLPPYEIVTDGAGNKVGPSLSLNGSWITPPTIDSPARASNGTSMIHGDSCGLNSPWAPWAAATCS